MSETTETRKTFKYQFMPTPTQELALDRALMLCHHSYNAAIKRTPRSLAHARRHSHLLPAESRIA
jgi:hypothetical protein